MMTPLGQIAKVSTGFPFRKKVVSEPGGDLTLVQIKDIDAAEGVSSSGTVMLNSDKRKYDRYLLSKDDLLFQARGSRHPVAIVGEGLKGIAATGLHVVRPDPAKVLPEYLAWWLNHPQSQERLSRDVAHGTYVPFVSKKDLALFPIPVPSMEVQQQIAIAHRLQQEHEALTARLNKLTEQLVDAITMAAATQDRAKENGS